MINRKESILLVGGVVAGLAGGNGYNKQLEYKHPKTGPRMTQMQLMELRHARTKIVGTMECFAPGEYNRVVDAAVKATIAAAEK